MMTMNEDVGVVAGDMLEMIREIARSETVQALINKHG